MFGIGNGFSVANCIIGGISSTGIHSGTATGIAGAMQMYEIGDIGSIERVNTFPFLYLKSLSGRKSDTIYLPSGKQSPGLTFYYISRSIFFKNNIVKEFRIIQKELNKFKFLIVAEKKIDKHDIDAIVDAANKYLEPGLVFEFEIVNKIHDRYKGKIQHFFSELEGV
mgnify:CR=1 FL=1